VALALLADLLSFRDGGVASNQQVPEKIELFSSVPQRKEEEQISRNRPVVKTRVTSPLTRVVAGSNPATGIMPV
jgi:hypothetical protein